LLDVKTKGSFGNRRQKGEEGEEQGEGEEEDEDVVVVVEDGLRWDRDNVNVSDLLQKRDEEGENTGEFETATEQDMFKVVVVVVLYD